MNPGSKVLSTITFGSSADGFTRYSGSASRSTSAFPLKALRDRPLATLQVAWPRAGAPSLAGNPAGLYTTYQLMP